MIVLLASTRVIQLTAEQFESLQGLSLLIPYFCCCNDVRPKSQQLPLCAWSRECRGSLQGWEGTFVLFVPRRLSRNSLEAALIFPSWGFLALGGGQWLSQHVQNHQAMR